MLIWLYSLTSWEYTIHLKDNGERQYTYFLLRKYLYGFISLCNNQVLTQFKQVARQSQGRRNLGKQRYKVSIFLNICTWFFRNKL